MASGYNYPENKIAWFIRGDNLAIITTDGSESGSTHSRLGDWKAINESVTDGILIHYESEPNSVSVSASGDYSAVYPDVDNSLHTSLVDYVKFRLYQDKAGSGVDPNISAISMNLSRTHESKWNESVRRFGMKKRDKVGGDRRIMLPDLR
jgi:hypothetical protein